MARKISDTGFLAEPFQMFIDLIRPEWCSVLADEHVLSEWISLSLFFQNLNSLTVEFEPPLPVSFIILVVGFGVRNINLLPLAVNHLNNDLGVDK